MASAEILIAGKDEFLPAFDGHNIPVFFGCDDRYLPHCLAAIASIAECASPEDRYDFWIVQSGIAEVRIAAVREWAGRWPNVSLRFMDMTAMIASSGIDFITTRDLSIATYYRIFAPQVFSRYDKMLYLDCDVIAMDDVGKLFREELCGCAVGVCHDPIMEDIVRKNPSVASYWREQLHLESGDPYFNSGMILMDLQTMRDNDLQRAILDKIGSITEKSLLDQDMLNSALKGKARYLDSRWNLFDFLLDETPRMASARDIYLQLFEQFAEARKRPGIVHFVQHKPWKTDYLGSNAGRYWKYAAMTPLYDELRKKLNAECSCARIAGKNILWSLQSLNYRLRLLCCGANKKEKYRDRIYNLKMLKKNTLRHMRAVKSLR